MSERRHYGRTGFLALDPRALTVTFEPAPKRENRYLATATVVEVMGPLEHHANECFDSYDEIGERVDAACKATAPVVILKIDSPGGDVSGAFDTARELRAKCSAAGKKMVAYVDGTSCSAAYALASAAERIVIPEAGIVGSIGVIHTRVDQTALDGAMGARFTLVTSGARKADGNPHTPMSDEEHAEAQRLVDLLAQVFFQVVADHRGMKTADVAGLEAGLFHGADAVSKRLADEVKSFDELLASLASAATGASMATRLEEARAALEEAAKGDGDEAARAKRALAAMDESDEKKDDEAKSEEHSEPDGDEAPAEKKDDEAKAAASVAASTAGDLAATVARLSQEMGELKAAREREDRAALLASRSDLPAELKKVLATKPLADVKAIVSAMPKPSKPAPAATATVQGTRGATQGAQETASTPESEQMDIAMGIKSQSLGIRRRGTTVEFGALSREEAARIAAEKGAAR